MILNWDAKDGLHRMQRWCGEQERSPAEVLRKLRGMGAPADEAKEILEALMAQGFVNQERFARSFARGKFRMKGWGRMLILRDLRGHGVSSREAWAAMDAEIEEAAYRDSLRSLAEKKARTLRTGLPRERSLKLLRYLMSRGYETDLCREILKEMKFADADASGED